MPGRSPSTRRSTRRAACWAAAWTRPATAARCPGFGDQRGYELLREAGLTAEQAVQVVSYNGARILGVDDRLGSVEKGKLADLVLLQGRPAWPTRR